MTVNEAIAKVDTLKPNMFDEKEKIKWLSQLDARIYREIIQTHYYNDGEEEVSFTGYSDGSGETDLIVGEPYDELYTHWLEAKIDYHNMEIGGFNRANQVFESVYESFRNAYNASHMPKGARKIYY